ncbi:MAG: glycosyltransferase family A protein [Paludibacter sp.]|nr:glycosyltransferase family A protein [Paludibacter sp.]
MTSALVSIITPTYNHEKYIMDCIRSAQEQSYTNWEMIIVDDGSTDRTYSIAQDLAKEDSRIQVFTQKNIGIFRLVETYNFALFKSKGKYIAVLEGDDIWLKDKLKLQVESMEVNENHVLSFGKAYSTSSDLKEDYYLTDFSKYSQQTLENNPLGSATQTLLFSNFLVALTVLVRRSTIEKIGGFKQSHNLPLVDLTTWIELSLYGSFSFINAPLGKWRFYAHQITKTYTAEISEGFYKFTLDFYEKENAQFLKSVVSKKQINQHFRKLLVEAHSRSGRYKLIRKDFKGARKNYMKSVFCFGLKEPLWKLRSVIGLFFSFFHADIETFAKKLGKISYK